jgi:hypothetical protein
VPICIQPQIRNSPREGGTLRTPTTVVAKSAFLADDSSLTPDEEHVAALRTAEAKLSLETDKLLMIGENVGQAMKELNVPPPLMKLDPEEALANEDLVHMRTFFSEKIKQTEQGKIRDDAALRVIAARIACFSDPEKPHYEARVTFELKASGPETQQLEQAIREYVAPGDVSVAVNRVARTPFWVVSVISLDARNAARRADAIGEALVGLFMDGGKSPVSIWEKAEIAAEPLPIHYIEESE